MLSNVISEELLMQYVTEYSVKIVGMIAILVVGWFLIKLFMKVVQRLMTKSKLDKTLASFLKNIIRTLLMAFVFIAAIDQLGINTTSLAAIFASAGLAIGFALKESLSNFSAGVMLTVLRPFKIGDFIEVGSISGTVKELNIYNTTLTTGDNKTVILPNAKLNNNNITNYSAQKLRRIDLVVGVSYNDDIKKVKSILSKIVKKDKRILKDPEVLIAVGELADSSVNFKVRPWVEKADYWDVYHSLNEDIKNTFDKEGITIPYPQQDINLYNVPKE